MTHRPITLTCALLLLASVASATTFVVPSDDELVGKAQAIVIGTVEGSYVRQTDVTIETTYEIRVERAVKGVVGRDELLRVVSPGGFIEGVGGVLVEGAAHFRQGDRVLLFLTRNSGHWETTDMTLGKFRFVTSTAGDRLAVRDAEDIVGWDRAGNVHHEKLRRADEFVRFVEDRAHGRKAASESSYLVDANDVTLDSLEPSMELQSSSAPVMETNAAPFPGDTYTDYVSNQPIRWPNMSAGVQFYKRSTTNISGVADGGASVIQNGLAAWTNDCASLINLSYAGETPTASQNFDAVHVVEFNDPQSRVGGSWTGSGTIAITFTSFGSSHSFAGKTWWSITDADVVFQDGYPGTHSTFPTAMTHELGHGIGWRHSNQSHLDGGACNPSVEECTSTAIMNSSVVNGIGYTLQPWDKNAAESVYPGGTCTVPCTAPVITSQPTSRTITAGSSTTLSVSATGTGPLTYQWFIGPSGVTTSPIAGATSSSIIVAPSATTSYWVRVTNSCGSVTSTGATVTVNQPNPTPGSVVRNDFNGDGRSDLFWRNNATGDNSIWFMNGTTFSGLATTGLSTSWQPQDFGDFDGDGKADVFWRNSSGQTVIWLMNGTAVRTSASSLTVADTNWKVYGSGDFNGDGRDDIFWRNAATSQSSIWFMNGTGSPSTTMLQSVPTAWIPEMFGDFNGDGRADVFWRNSSTGETSVWLMNGATITSAVRSLTVADVNWSVAGGGDFDGDGRADLFWRNRSTGANSIWLMNGGAPRSTLTATTVATDWTPNNFGTFDGNATTDIFWYRPSTGETSIWLMNGATATTAVRSTTVDTNWRPVKSF
jgi:hypothetical protein